MSACELAEAIVWNGRDINTLWTSGTDLPRTQQVRQVSGVCLTANGKLVLVSEAGTNWNLPGGHPESGEAPEETLARELLEEACAEVSACRLMGWQRIDDPREPAYLHLRSVARVRLQTFNPGHEIRHRRLVSPQEFLSALSWGRSSIAAEILRLALEAELP